MSQPAISKTQQALASSDRLFATMQDLDRLDHRAADLVKQIIEKQDLVEKQQREYEALVDELTDGEFFELCKLQIAKVAARLEKVTST